MWNKYTPKHESAIFIVILCDVILSKEYRKQKTKNPIIGKNAKSYHKPKSSDVKYFHKIRQAKTTNAIMPFKKFGNFVFTKWWAKNPRII